VNGSARDDVKGRLESKDISGTYRDTVVYVKGKDRWRDVFFQSTKVQP
jgi:hypothetical protein